jgi:putative PIG3 family NAD(P)H quinone oxidoreductase
MHAVVITEPGEPDVLRWEEVPNPRPAEGEVLIDVVAAGVNRADLLQRQGFYPPPPGAPPYPGLECSGTIAAVGPGVTGWNPGDEVCALLAGGGYAERVVVPAIQVLPRPRALSLTAAAAVPETVCTVYNNLFQIARLQPGETLLVHGGASGIGTTAIQLGKAFGARVICTVGSAAKAERCLELGADRAIDYKTEDFVSEVGPGRADVILDIIGAKYLARNTQALAVDGRLVVIGTQGGNQGEINLGQLMMKRATVFTTGLRARPPDQKTRVIEGVRADVWPLIEAGRFAPVIDTELPMPEAAQAHRLMASSDHIGKIVLLTGLGRVED